MIRRYFYHCDVEEILKIKLPTTPGEDWIAWNFEKSVMFSVRSAYRLSMREVHKTGAIGSSLSAEGEWAIWKKVWSTPVPSKS
jgi:hypothetical protein